MLRSSRVARERCRELHLQTPRQGAEGFVQDVLTFGRLASGDRLGDLPPQIDWNGMLARQRRKRGQDFVRMQRHEGFRDGAARSNVRGRIYQRRRKPRLQLCQRERADEFGGGLLSMANQVRTEFRHGDDRRIEPADRQPRVSISVVAIGDLEITLAAGERTQIPGDELRRVIARWKSFGRKVVLRRDGHTLASSGADWVPGGRGPKQEQAHYISLLRRLARVTVVPGEE